MRMNECDDVFYVRTTIALLEVNCNRAMTRSALKTTSWSEWGNDEVQNENEALSRGDAKSHPILLLYKPDALKYDFNEEKSF